MTKKTPRKTAKKTATKKEPYEKPEVRAIGRFADERSFVVTALKAGVPTQVSPLELTQDSFNRFLLRLFAQAARITVPMDGDPAPLVTRRK